jgi:hypothetical protein
MFRFIFNKKIQGIEGVLEFREEVERVWGTKLSEVDNGLKNNSIRFQGEKI